MLKGKQEALNTAIAATKEKLELEKQAAADAAKALEEGTITKTEYDALQAEVIKTTSELTKLETEAKNVGEALDTSFGKKASVAFTNLGQSLDSVGGKMQQFGSRCEDAGKKLTATVTAGVAALGTKSVKTAADFEGAMSQVAATMGTTTDSIGDLSELAQEMGATTAFSATEAAEGINILAMSGLSAEQITESLGDVLNLASAGAIDMGSSASYITGAVKGFGDEMSNAGYYADLMAKGATMANTDVKSLGEALSGSAATASSYGQEADTVTVSLLKLAEQNVTGSEAATSLNRAMADLYTPTTNAAKALDSLGISAYNTDGSAKDFNDVVDDLSFALSQLSDEEANNLKNTIFTTNGLNAFNKMTAVSTATIEKFWDGVRGDDLDGSAAQQAETQLDNLNGQITLLKSAIEGALITVGNALMPTIKKVVSAINEWVDKFNNLDSTSQMIILIVAGLVAAIGPLLIIIGKISTGLGAVVKGAGAISTFIGSTLIPAISSIGTTITATIIPAITPLLPVIAAVGLAIAAVIVVIKNWDAVVEVAQALWQGFTQFLSSAAESIKTAVTNAFNTLATNISNTVTAIKETVTNIWEGIKSAVVNTVTNIKASITNAWENIKTSVSDKINSLKTSITDTWENIKTSVSDKVDSLKTGITEKWESIKTAVSDKVTSIKSKIADTFENIKTGLSSKMSSIKTTITDEFTGAVDYIKNLPSQALTWGKDMIDGFVEGIKSKASKVTDAVKGVGDKIKSFLHFSRPDEGPLRDYETWMPDMMKGLAKGITANMNVMDSALSQLSSNVAQGINQPDNVAQLAGSQGSAVSTGDIIIPVSIGNTKLGTTIIKAQDIMNYRSGGR